MIVPKELYEPEILFVVRESQVQISGLKISIVYVIGYFLPFFQLELRQKQFHLLINTIHELQRMLEGETSLRNSWHSNISLYILYTVFHTFPKVLTRRISYPIKVFFFSDHFHYSHDFNVWFRGGYGEERLDISNYQGSKV